MRLFVSVDLPDSLAEPIETIQHDLADASGLEFVDPLQTHITLKFLGDVEADQLAGLEEVLGDAVDTAEVEPFEATVQGIGAFPSESYIRVVWVGIASGSELLTRLHEVIEDRTVDLGFDPETHDFTPHVTIARMKHAGGKELVQEYLRDQNPTIGSMQVDQVRLTESNLTADGPRYSTRTRFPL